MAPDERRKNIRVLTRLEVELNSGLKLSLKGVCTNLSAKGMFCECSMKPPIGSECAIVISLERGSISPLIRLRGKVVREDPKGVAMEFTGLEFKDYEQLKNFIIYTSSDPDAAEAEFKKDLGIKRLK